MSFSKRRYGIIEGPGELRESIYSSTVDLKKMPLLSGAYLSLATQAGAVKLHHHLLRFPCRKVIPLLLFQHPISLSIRTHPICAWSAAGRRIIFPG
jgi:hypothetical protein